MSFVEVWFCIIGTIYVLNSVVNTLIKIYEVFDDEDDEEERILKESAAHGTIPEEIKRALYS